MGLTVLYFLIIFISLNIFSLTHLSLSEAVLSAAYHNVLSDQQFLDDVDPMVLDSLLQPLVVKVGLSGMTQCYMGAHSRGSNTP